LPSSQQQIADSRQKMNSLVHGKIFFAEQIKLLRSIEAMLFAYKLNYYISKLLHIKKKLPTIHLLDKHLNLLLYQRYRITKPSA